ncbi:MAG: hypothetical protein WCG20_03640 [bacterium]
MALTLGELWFIIVTLINAPVIWFFWRLAFTATHRWIKTLGYSMSIFFIIVFITCFVYDTYSGFDTSVILSNVSCLLISGGLFTYYRKSGPRKS